MTTSMVTGASGFVGSHLVERLLALGHDVVGIDCYTDHYERARKERNLAAAHNHDRFRFTEADLVRLGLGPFLENVDYVFHLAGQPGVRPSWGQSFGSYVHNNVLATQHLLEAAKDRPIKKVVYASSSSIYGDAKRLPVNEEALPRPMSPYGVTKLAAEQLFSLYTSSYGVRTASLRLFTVYGPRQRPDMAIQRFLSAAASGKVFNVLGDGDQSRDFTFVHDAVDAFLQAAESTTDGGVFNICGGSTITINELLAAIEDVTGQQLRIEHKEAARGDVRHTLGDSSRARRAIGFTPRVGLRAGLSAHWRWVQEQEASAPAKRASMETG